ncbi:MAG: IS110 family transposase [Actinomyces succiniciruminis]|nr:IS110 family transposase [Actinomyces succiniciruminis]
MADSTQQCTFNDTAAAEPVLASASPSRAGGRWVVAGVDTHKDTHHVAVLDALTGQRLGDMQVPATPAGYSRLLDFAAALGQVQMIGIEGTGSYGAGLARALRAAGAPIREVIRPKRSQRRRGKSDRIDAYAAAQQALAETETLPIAKTGQGQCEQIRVLLAERRSAVKAATATKRQISALIITAPAPLRTRLTGLNGPDLEGALTNTTDNTDADADNADADATGRAVTATTRQVLARLARRQQALDQEINDIDTQLHTLTQQAAPAMLATKGYGPVTTATLLVTAGDNPDRIHNEASFAALCGACPIPASSGKTNRHRLNRGGDRQANWALHQVARSRLAHDPRTQAYAKRLAGRNKTPKDIMRCLKRAIAREAFHLLTNPPTPPRTDDLRKLRQQRGLTLTQAANHLGTHPPLISRLERGLHHDTALTNNYRQWLNTHP